ncbi:MAG TPA: tRNA (N6-isopentenyl adenosine(37)-C2)-methylthiotransferase MiaB [Polyangiaceae bacterium]|nr:tRNA (N6-isopentenyl adenosine(37)-C2)-methylthiotransferase MiaB [Polyangiaceae bacterium]
MARFTIVTFGCQMNEHDSARIAEILATAGHHPVESVESADVVVLNTCSVREKAAQKLRSEVGRLGLVKNERRDLLIVVAGCLGQQEGKRLLTSAPEIDLVIGPDNIPELPALLRELELGGPRRIATGFDLDSPTFLSANTAVGRPPPATYVTVMKGCDERCSFCIVPYTRGAERYRPARQIIEEVESLVASGVSEVTLLGQTVNSYRDPEQQLPKAPASEIDWVHTSRTNASADESEFAALLWELVARVPRLRRLRYTSPHPRHLTRALIEAHRGIPILAKHLHLPVQSGNNRVLRRMIRRYTREEYEERVESLLQAVPGLTLSTDIIVGFPGETPQEFEDTLSLVDQLRFVGVFAFKYSPRPFTPALKLEDDVSEAEKSERLAALFDRHDPFRQAHLERLVGSVQHVLIEGTKADGAFTGRTERNEIVHVAASSDITGEILPVKIARAFKNSLAAELLDESRRIPANELPRLAAAPSSGNLRHQPAVEKRLLPVI